MNNNQLLHCFPADMYSNLALGQTAELDSGNSDPTVVVDGYKDGVFA